MNRQLDMFGDIERYPDVPGHVRGSMSSAMAAERITPCAPSLRNSILKQIVDSKLGITCDEIEREMGLRHQTASARLAELKHAGKIYADGFRSTRSGARASVWRAVHE